MSEIKTDIKMVQEAIKMELKKVWMSPETEKKSNYGYRTVGGILGIVFLMTALLFAGNFLSLSLGLPQQSFSMILVLLATALGIILAVKLGRRGMQAVSYTHLDVYKRQVRDISIWMVQILQK